MSKEKTKNICLKTKRLEIFPKSLEEMRKLQEQEQDPQMKQAYGEMIDGMETHPKDWFWYSDWTVAFKDKTVVGGICFKGAPDEKGEVGMCMGMLFGVAIGSSLDAADKKKRGELQEMRAADKENYED